MATVATTRAAQPRAAARVYCDAVPRRSVSTLACLALLALAALASAPSPASAASSTVWLCRPGLTGNPCTPGLSTTRFSPSGRRLGVTHPTAVRNPKFDCLYLYPTVSNQKTVQANLHIDPVERSIALYQAARYSQYCRVYAPMYRQATLNAILDPRAVTPAVGLAIYRDALNGWRTYLRRYNRGRGVVLIGHSQGSFVLRRLIASEIDPKPALRARLISALLLGGNVAVRRGRDVGGDFKHVRACHSRTQLGCVVAFSTFDAAVPANSKFGRTTVAGQQVLCTNPAALGGGSGLVDTIFPTKPFDPTNPLAAAIKLLGVTLPTAPTTWIDVPGGYRTRCSSAGGGMVSEHTYGDAVDIAEVNGIPIVGHQGAGSITDITERRIMTLQGSMQPNQLISLMTYPGVSYAWAQSDHADHIHVGFQPMFGQTPSLNAQYASALKPDQWVKLVDRINHIDEPIVPTKPSKYALPVSGGN